MPSFRRAIPTINNLIIPYEFALREPKSVCSMPSSLVANLFYGMPSQSIYLAPLHCYRLGQQPQAVRYGSTPCAPLCASLSCVIQLFQLFSSEVSEREKERIRGPQYCSSLTFFFFFVRIIFCADIYADERCVEWR